MPRDEAMKVWQDALAKRTMQLAIPKDHAAADQAAATVIDEALAKRDAEIAEQIASWLDKHSGSFKARTVAQAIRSGEYRKTADG